MKPKTLVSHVFPSKIALKIIDIKLGYYKDIWKLVEMIFMKTNVSWSMTDDVIKLIHSAAFNKII